MGAQRSMGGLIAHKGLMAKDATKDAIDAAMVDAAFGTRGCCEKSLEIVLVISLLDEYAQISQIYGCLKTHILPANS